MNDLEFTYTPDTSGTAKVALAFEIEIPVDEAEPEIDLSQLVADMEAAIAAEVIVGDE